MSFVSRFCRSVCLVIGSPYDESNFQLIVSSIPGFCWVYASIFVVSLENLRFSND